MSPRKKQDTQRKSPKTKGSTRFRGWTGGLVRRRHHHTQSSNKEKGKSYHTGPRPSTITLRVHTTRRKPPTTTFTNTIVSRAHHHDHASLLGTSNTGHRNSIKRSTSSPSNGSAPPSHYFIRYLDHSPSLPGFRQATYCFAALDTAPPLQVAAVLCCHCCAVPC